MTAPVKPLEGIRVVNISLNLPGPAAAQRLHQLGAEVTKVEPPGGDFMEGYQAAWYRDMRAGHTVIRLDLKTAEGQDSFARLLEESDLLITASRTAALARLGLDWETLHAKYPRLCQVAIVGYPAPREHEAGHDLTYQSCLGLLTPPHMPRTLIADMAGAERAVSTAMGLLLARERGEGGGYAEVPLSDAAAAMAAPLTYGLTAPGALLGGGVPEYNIYRVRDGWIALAALEPHFKKRVEESLGVTSLQQYEEAFATRSAAEWRQWGQELDIPVVVVPAFQ